MSTQIRHFVLTADGNIREFSAEEAAAIAAGASRLPEFADRRLRYLQVTWDAETEAGLQIQTAGAAIRFDGEGRLAEAIPPCDQDRLSRFEHDTCVQWALRGLASPPLTQH
ncbi:MAG: hypothetical protein KGJ55_07625 [Gammaproteobacteria bacterium]|nr:hypothetical protein [Gammaproteobacteria bacterium]